ncbi:MAG: maleylpyruvate isomerase family mycothiol-dependent enzyme [Aeromicrobium sp.]|uniref:maleylpyruvate isomerase family mycothiol-dependent enzyme n=1 Tax=Aeromicrobium sp. TaxID=1871063 RepID=UPI0039E60A6A
MDVQQTYVAGWKQAVDAVVELARELTPEQLAAPTDCPGWSAHDVIAHLAHLEEVTNGEPEEGVAGAVLVSDYTEAGVAARRDVPTTELIDSLERETARRHAFLVDADLDLSQPAPVTPGGVAWTWDTLLRNRVIDAWCHEQDVRRAVGHPGGLDSVGAHVVTHTFAAGLGFVLGKRAQATPGTTVRWNVTGPVTLDVALTVGDDGRARPADPDVEPTATLTMTTEEFTVLGAGRRSPEQLDVTVEGDANLARRVLSAMALTP